MKKTLIALALASACIAPAHAAKDYTAEVSGMKWWDACLAYGVEYRSNKNPAREEALNARLTRENALNSKDRGSIGDKSVQVGMTECGMFAAIGKPDVQNVTESASGRTSQFVYRSKYMYIYTFPDRASGGNVIRTIQR